MEFLYRSHLILSTVKLKIFRIKAYIKILSSENFYYEQEKYKKKFEPNRT
jgi:hypothetical protein